MAIESIGGVGTREAYSPDIYSPELKERFRHNTLLTRVCNRAFEGKFRRQGGKIIIRTPPLIRTQKYVNGQVIAYQDPDAFKEEHTINRARYYAFIIRDIDAAFSDIKNFAATWTKEGAKQLAEDNETEWFSDIYAKCHASNQGNTAGVVSGEYKLGTTAAPLTVYKTQALATAATGVTVKNTAVDAIAEAAACLQEQPGGLGLNPWIILPVWYGQYIQTGELKDASVSGDGQSLLRKSVQSIGSIAGFDVYLSNLLPSWAADSGESLPKRYLCLYGDNSAISFADEIDKTELLRDKDEVGDFHRSLMVYDWFVRYSERFGHMIVAKG